jgi:p-methyltransferase
MDDVIIVCRKKRATVDIKKTSLKGMLVWGSHLKQKYLVRSLSDGASVREIKARIQGNLLMPEWIGNHRFGLFDLLNYVRNGYRYVYDPGEGPEFFDPIGIPSSTSIHISGYLTAHGFRPVNVDNFEVNCSQFETALKRDPVAVAVSATFLSVEEIADIIRFVRRINRTVPIVIGSSYLFAKLDSKGHLVPEYERLLGERVYAILEEDGLATLDRLIRTKSANGELEKIPNLVFVDNGLVKYTEKRIAEYDFDLRYPDWSNVASLAKGIAFIRSSQGCPYKCKFCTFPKASPRFRQRSVQSIRDELRQIRSAGITSVAFTDDHFAHSPSRVERICRMMLDEKFGFDWFAGIRASAINENTAQLLEESGCKVLCVGLESGDDRILDLMNKNTTASSNMECLEILDRHNITAYGSFMVGFPGETVETVNNTIDWINNSPLKLYKVFMFFLLPGAIIYDEREEYQVSFFGDNYHHYLWKTPTMNSLEASELLKEFILRVERAALIYNYSPMYAFFPLLSAGYSMDESLEFLRIRTALIKNELSGGSFFSKERFRRSSLGAIERLLNSRK